MGKGATALKKINARVKVLKKKHPNSKRSTLQKQAGAEYRAGKLKVRRKPAKKKVARKRRVAPRKKAAVKRRRKSAPRKRARRAKLVTRTVVKYRVLRPKRKGAKVRIKVSRRRSVSGAKKSFMPLLLAVGAVAALMLLKPKPAVYIPTGNASRDSQAANIMAYAAAFGATTTAIANLIKTINAANASGAALPDNSAVQAIISQTNPTGAIAGPRRLMS